MTGKTTHRKSKAKHSRSEKKEHFKLPDSLSTSEVDFPIILRPKAKACWRDIIKDYDKWHQQFQHIEENKIVTIESPLVSPESDYIKNEVFVHLIPALIETLNKAKMWQALANQNCFFNGIDHMAQVLWNNNPRYPERKKTNLHLFNMPWVRQHLKKQPREFYPKGWLWSEDHAAIIIQKTFRQYLVQKEMDVQEMRTFWKKVRHQRQSPDMQINPFLAKKFATGVMITRH